jgi:6-phosphogluconolactonase
MTVGAAAATLDVLPDPAALARAAAEHIAAVTGDAISARGRASLALAGGATPRLVYELIARPPVARRVDWARVHVFWSDERCVPPDDPRSNYRLARQTFLDVVPVPAAQIHRIRGEADPLEAAADYDRTLRTFFGAAEGGADAEGGVDAGGGADARASSGFDLMLLGMGDDGHVASLFPGSPALAEKSRWVMAHYFESDELWRVTLTLAAINSSRQVLVLVAGAGKAERLRDVFGTAPGAGGLLPAQLVRPAGGRVRWMVDAAAASLLERGR